MKGNRKLIALSAILVVLIAAFLGLKAFNTTIENKIKEEKAAAQIQLTDVGKLRKITYTNESEKIKLVKQKKQWVFADEPEVELDQSYPSAIETEIMNLTAAQEIQEPDALKYYGLDAPAYTIKATDKEGNQVSLYVGDGVDDGYYLTVDGKEKVYIVGSSLVSSIQYERNQLVKNDKIPSIGSDQITEVVIESPATGKTAYKKDENKDEIATILGGMGALSFDGCVNYNAEEEEIASYGLDADSRITVTVTYKVDSDKGEKQKEKAFKIHIGNVDDSNTYRYVQVDGSRIVNKALKDTADNLLNENQEENKQEN